jgi:hypothetical protein
MRACLQQTFCWHLKCCFSTLPKKQRELEGKNSTKSVVLKEKVADSIEKQGNLVGKWFQHAFMQVCSYCRSCFPIFPQKFRFLQISSFLRINLVSKIGGGVTKGEAIHLPR